MINLFPLSLNTTTPYKSSFIFYFQRLTKWLSILFKPKRKLKEIEFNYYKNWHFDNAYLTIQYEFLNAVWVEISGAKKIYSNTPIILNLQNIDSPSINIFVHGFFSKRKYTIYLNKADKINSQFFKTKV